MERDPILTLLGLIAVAGIALTCVAALLRTSRRGRGRGILRGYPPALFPQRDLVREGPLAALATTQSRLMAAYEQVPPRSDLAVWLETFLQELRAIMDSAYRVATIARLYQTSAPLDRLVAEIQQIEQEVAGHVVSRLLARDADTHDELLEGRLATLRMCGQELARLAEAEPLQRILPPQRP